MNTKLKLVAAALTIAAGTLAACIGPAKADTIVIHRHHFGHARMVCLDNGGYFRDGECLYPRHIHYRGYYPERVRHYDNNGYWSHGVWYND